jgi:hypothetical protein
MTVRPTFDRQLLDEGEFARPRSTTPLVSSNFESCPTCGTRKHLLMACPACGFSRSGNPERVANKSHYDEHYRDYADPPVVEQERPAPHTPIVRWKRSKVSGKGNLEEG